MDPVHINQNRRETIQKIAYRFFTKECLLLEKCGLIDYLPDYYSCEGLPQDNTWLFPGGYLYAIAMSKVPGCAVIDIENLSQHELEIIRDQLADTLEYVSNNMFMNCTVE